MNLHPEPEYNNSAITAFHVPDSADTARWTACEDPRVNERLSIFLRTGAMDPGQGCGWTTTISSESSILARAQWCDPNFYPPETLSAKGIDDRHLIARCLI